VTDLGLAAVGLLGALGAEEIVQVEEGDAENEGERDGIEKDVTGGYERERRHGKLHGRIGTARDATAPVELSAGMRESLGPALNGGRVQAQ